MDVSVWCLMVKRNGCVSVVPDGGKKWMRLMVKRNGRVSVVPDGGKKWMCQCGGS
jgi:ribosomal protein L36